jgi:hypothetical protein
VLDETTVHFHNVDTDKLHKTDGVDAAFVPLNPDGDMKAVESWPAPVGEVCVLYPLRLLHLSPLDFDYKTRNALEIMVTRELKKVISSFDSYNVKVSVVGIEVPDRSDLDEFFTIKVDVQIRLPAVKAQAAIYTLRNKLDQQLAAGHLIDASEPATLQDKCLSTLVDCSCSDHGTCSGNVCVCDAGYAGDYCADKRCEGDCSSNGVCNDGICQCAEGWTGLSCNIKTCIETHCKHGTCTAKEGSDNEDENVVVQYCKCDLGYTGPDCSIYDLGCGEGDSCNGGGECNLNTCQCFPGYSGSRCEVMDCPPDNCNGNGQCFAGRCECNEGWMGEGCAIKTCLNKCSNHGICDGTMCKCDLGWKGSKCESEL